MDSVEYMGYRINAHPQQLIENEEWTINITIEAHHGSHVNTRNFSASNTFKNREEAIKHCFHFGKRIIDGKTNVTISDL